MFKRHSYRLMLAGVFYLQNTRKVCCGLAVLVEAAAVTQAAKPSANKVVKAEVKDASENKKEIRLELRRTTARGDLLMFKKGSLTTFV